MKEHRHSPLELTMALHYVTINEPYALRHPEHRYSPAVSRIKAHWLNIGYLERTGDTRADMADYRPTQALQIWVEALCNVPAPVRYEGWKIPESKA